ncbi:MAG: hypothetical protein KH026_10870, partial [Clostridium sp.]|nr:hypothetical protein [Clostridium sp.]
ILYKGADKFSFTGSGRLSWIKYPAQSSTWNTSSTSILKYFDIRSINSAEFPDFSDIISNRHKNPFFQFYRYFLIFNYAK